MVSYKSNMDQDIAADAYDDTLFWVDFPDSPMQLTLGSINEAFDRCIAQHGVRCWAYLTAYNPQAETRPVSENESRHAALLKSLKAEGLEAVPGRDVSKTGAWPAERGVLVLDVAPGEAQALGRRFEQVAVIVGCIGRAPHLLFC